MYREYFHVYSNPFSIYEQNWDRNKSFILIG